MAQLLVCENSAFFSRVDNLFFLFVLAGIISRSKMSLLEALTGKKFDPLEAYGGADSKSQIAEMAKVCLPVCGQWIS